MSPTRVALTEAQLTMLRRIHARQHVERHRLERDDVRRQLETKGVATFVELGRKWFKATITPAGERAIEELT